MFHTESVVVRCIVPRSRRSVGESPDSALWFVKALNTGDRRASEDHFSVERLAKKVAGYLRNGKKPVVYRSPQFWVVKLEFPETLPIDF